MGEAVAWSAAAAVGVVMAEAGELAAGKVGEAWLKVGEMGEAVAWSAAAAVGVVMAEAGVLIAEAMSA